MSWTTLIKKGCRTLDSVPEVY
ncbi:MAG: CD1375 family protein [Spirochaetota bacterium]